jgi:Xaa-Pro dipeptidase
MGAGLAAGGSLASCVVVVKEAQPAPPTAPERVAAEGEAEDLFPQLSDQRHTVEPIAPEERAARRQRLGHVLSLAGVDAYFCEGGPTMTYLSGVSWGHSERVFGLMVFADGSHAWVSPAFEASRAALRTEGEDGPGGEIVTWNEHEYARHALDQLLTEHRVGRVALDPNARLLVHDELSGTHLSPERIVSGREVVVELRGLKDEHELALIRRANELTQEAITAAAEHVTVGMTGADVSRLMRQAQTKLGLRGVWVLALVGPAAAYPHGTPEVVTLGEGDFLLVDTGGSLHEYQSDNTRTWVPEGAPNEYQLKVWNTVRDAQQRAFEAIRPGRPCADIDRVARAAIDAADFGPDYRTFTHRLGHGIGMQGHEDPYFDSGSQVILKPGMTLSNEPGIYLPGEFGVRLEDIIAVTEDGADHFGNWQAGPDSPISISV